MIDGFDVTYVHLSFPLDLFTLNSTHPTDLDSWVSRTLEWMIFFHPPRSYSCQAWHNSLRINNKYRLPNPLNATIMCLSWTYLFFMSAPEVVDSKFVWDLTLPIDPVELESPRVLSLEFINGWIPFCVFGAYTLQARKVLSWIGEMTSVDNVVDLPLLVADPSRFPFRLRLRDRLVLRSMLSNA